MPGHGEDPVVDCDAQVAWLLADAAEPDLIAEERTQVFIDLDAGDNHLAVQRILTGWVITAYRCPPRCWTR